jgi:hypothetical protein
MHGSGFLRDEIPPHSEMSNYPLIPSTIPLTKVGVVTKRFNKGVRFIKNVQAFTKRVFRLARFKETLLGTEDPFKPDSW